MIDAGIHPDDAVVVEKRISANVGDIVVAIVGNEFTFRSSWTANEAGSC